MLDPMFGQKIIDHGEGTSNWKARANLTLERVGSHAGGIGRSAIHDDHLTRLPVHKHSNQ
jgi:hypothetical protein